MSHCCRVVIACVGATLVAAAGDDVAMPTRGISAHRGASATHPENTLAAFREALRLGVHQIEFDIRYYATCSAGATTCPGTPPRPSPAATPSSKSCAGRGLHGRRKFAG